MLYPDVDGRTNYEAGGTMSFTIEGTFDSFDELQSRIKQFQVASNVQLTHRDSRTLTAVKKRVPKEWRKQIKTWYTSVLT